MSRVDEIERFKRAIKDTTVVFPSLEGKKLKKLSFEELLKLSEKTIDEIGKIDRPAGRTLDMMLGSSKFMANIVKEVEKGAT